MIEAAEMRTLRHLAGYTRLVKKINTDIWEKLKVSNILEEVATCRKRRKVHVYRMGEDRWPKMAQNYKPTG
jgi:hypothetical protein